MKLEEEDKKINSDNSRCKRTSKICKCNKCKVETLGKSWVIIITWLTKWKLSLIIILIDHLQLYWFQMPLVILSKPKFGIKILIFLIMKMRLSQFYRYSLENLLNMLELKLLNNMKINNWLNTKSNSYNKKKLNWWKLKGLKNKEHVRMMKLIEETFNKELLKIMLSKLRENLWVKSLLKTF